MRTEQAPQGSSLTSAREATLSTAQEDAAIRAFLIADIRGYTLFTQERGDEAAARLAAKFADIVHEHVQARDGSVIELRGDEALAVFRSPRQAIRAAVELQARFLQQTMAAPDLPLPVGIGLDAGEAVPVEDGYRGGALNLAARLCSEAGPGEILGSQSLVHLARTIEGVRYLDRGDLHLKGLSDPVHVLAIASEGSGVGRWFESSRPHEIQTRKNVADRPRTTRHRFRPVPPPAAEQPERRDDRRQPVGMGRDRPAV
jgi:class 3 adenylate cyclase